MDFYIFFGLLFIIFINKYGNSFTPTNHLRNIIKKYASNSNDLSDKFKTDNIEETDMVKLLNNFKNNSGFDERHFKNETLDNEIIQNIKISFIKSDLLNQLLSSRISQNTKIELLQESSDLFEEPKYSINITAGGLFKDWDFSI